jgi:predicted CXXCH cytochrome family protein
MRVTLRRNESLGGLLVATDEEIEVDRVTLGRGTDQNVQLPDLRVTLAHAEIRLQPGGGYQLECLGENPVWLNGSPLQRGAIGVGDTIDIGRFRLTVGIPPRGVDLLLEIAERVTAREEKGRQRERYAMDLGATTLRKRRAAWGLAVLVLLPLLLVPAAVRYASGGDARASFDAFWQSGPPSAAHGAFVPDCDVCHQTPFAAVANDACLACHKEQAHHSARPEVLALPGIADARCGACHQEHGGRHALIARNTALCTDCHARPDEQYAVAGLVPVTRFSGDHPGFTLRLPSWKEGRLETGEAAQAGGALREQTNLAFSHEAHLAAAGVNSPEGRRVLECGDCHQADGARFEPIRMEAHCSGCHRLDFDPGAPGRQVPHGQPREVTAIIRDYFARMALAGEVREPDAPEVVRLLRRPGETLSAEQSRAALGWADARATQVLQDVFERRLCATCHEVSATDDPGQPWDVESVALTGRFLVGARFDHAAHRTETCERCHDARAAKTSETVLVPGIENCRGCHGDPGDGGGLIGSACVDCHGFHTAGSMQVPDKAAP